MFKVLGVTLLQAVLLSSAAIAADAGDNRFTKALLPINPKGITGDFANRNDADWYKLNIIEGQHYSIVLDANIPAEAFVNIEMDFINPGKSKVDNYQFLKTDPAGIEFTAQESGLRYVAVHVNNVPKTVRFPLKYHLTARKECSDHIDTTCSLTVPTEQTGRLDWRGDYDDWKLDVEQGKCYLVDATLSSDPYSIYISTIDDHDSIIFPGAYGVLEFCAKYTGKYFIHLYTWGVPRKYTVKVLQASQPQ